MPAPRRQFLMAGYAALKCLSINLLLRFDLPMQELFFHVSNVLVPVFICVLVGLGLAKFKVYFDTGMVGSLVSNIGYPTLILSHLSNHQVSFAEFLDVMQASVLMIASFGVSCFLFLKIVRLPFRAYLSPMMMSNVGNIGLPVSYLAYGDQGMSFALAVVVVVLVCIFTIGMWLPIGQISLRSLVRQPVIYAVIVALLLMDMGIKLPVPIQSCFTILGGLAIPLMLLTLGYTLAGLNIRGVLKGVMLALFHLSVAVVIACTITEYFGFQGTARGVFILMCLMPASVATYLWVEKYQSEHSTDVAAFIMSPTLLTVFVVPLTLTYWL